MTIMGWRLAGLVGAVLLGAGGAAAQQPAPVTVELPYESFTLANGLRVLVHEDHSAPLVAVNVWYHVGSRNERPGRTGFAHLFEHLMFEGSANVPEGQIDQLVLTAGGSTPNGTTSQDRTNYFQVVPSSGLELLLWLESDRMGWLLPTMTQEKLDAQRDVVKNERRENYENRPYGLAYPTLLANLFPPTHPYSWPAIGSMEDLAAASMADVQDFFRTYYAPNNASLAIAGAVDPAAVRVLVERYFGEIPAGPPVPPVAAQPVRLEGDRYVTLEDRVRLPRLYMVWHTPASYAPGDAALDVAAAILGGGKASRLFASLVYDRQVAQDVQAFQSSQTLGSTFSVIATARPGTTLDELQRSVREELGRIAAAGVEDRELERATNAIETSFVDDLQRVVGKADRLNHYLFHTGDPGYAARDLARYRTVTAADVQAAVATYLAGAPAVVLSVVPEGQAQLAATEAP
jgi:zinc protease